MTKKPHKMSNVIGSPFDDVDLQNGESVTLGIRSNFVRRQAEFDIIGHV